MNAPRIEWDESKNGANRKKHGISFEEASTVSADENALLLADPDHSTAEDRFLLMGFSSSLRILVVCHCFGEEARSFALSRPAKLPELSMLSTPRGGENEKRIRLFQGEKESLCEVF
jgi:uncharacterized DUF497 family protein